MTQMKKKIAPLIECVSESTTACLVTMVQGNLLVLTLGHLAIASQTGIFAGAITFMAIFVTRTRKRWIVSVALGAITAVVDFLVHSGQFVPVATEALVTGFVAALMSYLAGTVIQLVRTRFATTD